ncbi:MAG: alpha-2-macroglobulin family protein, partial [Bacteroidia bacterium]|nr:alpha-2-macroglobulin family protein [Bacteroidia bacterium]
KALMVDGYDLYPFLLPELKLRRSSSGGDGYDLAKRVNPITSKRVKLVSAWSGILKTNAGGTASYTMDIPAFSGDLRIMAVAYQDQAFGSAEAHMKVADPVVISSALPRFASPGDTVEVPVTFSNTTMQTISAQAEVSGGGVLQVAGGGSRALQLSPGQEQRFLYKIIAAKGTGEGSFTVKVKHGHETYQDKTELSVRQPAGLQRRSGSGSISGGSTANIDLQFGFTPATAEAELIVSKSPLLAFADHMKYLLDYPHGCAEQSISVSFPQIYYGDLAKSISNRPGHPINVQGNVQACITKILSLQHYNGGIVTWPGSSSGNAWTSAYAAHFLSEARQAGYEVNEKGFEKLLDYLQKQAREKTYEELWYTQPGNTIVSRKVPSKAIFYSLYVLALNNKADRSSMNYYKSKSAELALDSKYMLAACYLAIGDRRTYTELLPKRFEGEQSQSSTGGSFYSYIRDMAMALNALLQTDPDHPQVGELVRMLSAELKNRTWLNTQERALSFLALGKFSRKAAQSEITATVSTEKGSPYRFDGKDLVIRKGISDQRIRINTQGKGNLYYFWNSSGLSVDGAYVQEDKNLKVRKTFFNRNGQEISGRIFRQNELIVVRISLENLSRSFIENIVVSDLLPAGFEIENPRISSIPDLDWIKNNSASEHIDLRDDRIHIYTGLGTQPQYFYYVVRAVSPGNYVMGPVSADAMYSGEYHSMHGSGRVQIK